MLFLLILDKMFHQLFLQALGDIQIAFKMLKQGDMSENPVDRHYHSLKCDLEALDHSNKEFKVSQWLRENIVQSTCYTKS